MKIEHIAIWTKDLEAMKAFYVKYFQTRAGEKYHNPIKKFQSYFLTFDGGCRLELMHMENEDKKVNDVRESYQGLSHFAISLGNKQKVDLLTEQLRQDGFSIVGEPRTTGDGYYESVALDPEGNRIELTA